MPSPSQFSSLFASQPIARSTPTPPPSYTHVPPSTGGNRFQGAVPGYQRSNLLGNVGQNSQVFHGGNENLRHSVVSSETQIDPRTSKLTFSKYSNPGSNHLFECASALFDFMKSVMIVVHLYT